MTDRTAILQTNLTAASVKEDPVAFPEHMNLCAIKIHFHEAAIHQVKRQGLPPGLLTDHQKISLAAACKITSAIRMSWPTEDSGRIVFPLQSTFSNWHIVLAMKPLCRELVSLKPRDSALSGAGYPLRLLLSALDRSEEADGFWHNSKAAVVATLQNWENKGGFDALGS